MNIATRLSPSRLMRGLLISVLLCPAAAMAQPLPAPARAIDEEQATEKRAVEERATEKRAVEERATEKRAVEKRALAHIRVHLGQGRVDAALALIESFLERASPPALTDQFTFLYAIALHRQARDTEAVAILEQFLEEYPKSPLRREAQLRLGAFYIETRRPKPAIALLSRMLDRTSDETTRRAAHHYLRRAYELRGHYLPAVRTAMAHMKEAKDAERGDLLDTVNGLILQKMDERTLAELLEVFPAAYPGDLALIRLIELHTARGDEILAELDIRDFLHRFPAHPYTRTATALLHSFMAKIKAHRHVVATLLPLSGPMKAFGTEAFRGVRLALQQEAFLGSNAVGLVVKDSARTAAPLRREVAGLIESFHPIALIGPLSAREARRLADVADRAAVPFITPTATLPDVKRLGRYWFSTAMTTPLQVGRLVAYAMQEFGYTRFCVLTPRTVHGRRLNHIFRQTVTGHGGIIVAEESYEPGTTDATAQITRLKAKDLRRDGRMEPADSGALTDSDTLADSDTPDAPDAPDAPPVQSDKPPVYVPGFDALFLPGRLADVAFLSAQLDYLDVTVPLLGTSGWNHPNLLPWGHHSLDGGLFGDALFLQSDDPDVRHFVTGYRERFQTDPSVFAAQAYDAMRAVLDTIRRGATVGGEVRDQLTERRDLPTLGGVGRFDEGGILDRKVYMIHIRNGRLVQVN